MNDDFYDDDCCCEGLVVRIGEAVASFFTTIAKAIWSAITWIASNLCCCEEDDVDDDLYGLSGRAYVPAQSAMPAFNSSRFSEDAFEIPDADDSFWAPVLPNNQALGAPAGPAIDLFPLARQSGLQSPASPIPLNETDEQRQKRALGRIQQIQARMGNPRTQIRFEVHPHVLSFNFDAALRTFSTATPLVKLKDLFNYAGPGTASPLNRNSSHDNPQKYAARVAAEITLHQKRKEGLDGIIHDHATGTHNVGPFTGEKVNHAKDSLSQLFNILNNKIAKARAGIYPPEKIKAEIRHVIDSLGDAYLNCIDQINAQLERLLLSSIASELNQDGISPISIFGAHALFEYRSNLLNDIVNKVNHKRCTDRNLQDWQFHTADLERMIKKDLAGMLNIESRLADVGANYNNLFADYEDLKTKIFDLFMRKYNHPENRGEIDDRPLAFLERGVEKAELYAPLEKLRTMLLEWVKINFRLETTPDGMEYINPDVTAIMEVISVENDPVGDVQGGGSLSTVGIMWLLEAAGITRELR